MKIFYISILFWPMIMLANNENAFINACIQSELTANQTSKEDFCSCYEKIVRSTYTEYREMEYIVSALTNDIALAKAIGNDPKFNLQSMMLKVLETDSGVTSCEN